jgi:Na+/melibiose symporter-like transporter
MVEFFGQGNLEKGYQYGVTVLCTVGVVMFFCAFCGGKSAYRCRWPIILLCASSWPDCVKTISY